MHYCILFYKGQKVLYEKAGNILYIIYIIISPLHFKATPRKIVLNAKTIH